MSNDKPKKPRSAAQLANDQRLRDAAKARREANATEEEFTPTEVEQHLAAEQAKAEKEGLKAPVAPEGAEITDVLPEDNKPTSAPQPSVQIDPNLVASIAVAVAEALRQNPQVAQAPAEQKLDELADLAPSRTNKARLGRGGEVQGIVYRYEIDKNYYPDPTARLMQEPQLARFAPEQNFIFRWQVDGVEYEKNKIAYAEPRFTLELFSRIFDDEGQPTGQAALVARQMLHEDEFTTRILAGRMGILDQFEDSEEGFRALMSEIRYQRFRSWLLAIFTPAKIETHRRRPIEQNIGGKIVMVYDTEALTDSDSASAKVSTLASQEGIGKVSTPE